MSGCKSRLFDLCKIIIGYLIQLHCAHVNERKFSVRPDFREIERIPAEVLGLFVRHHLNLECPLWELSLFDRLDQIALRIIRIDAAHCTCALVREIHNSLLGLEVKLYPNSFILRIDKRKGMAAES